MTYPTLRLFALSAITLCSISTANLPALAQQPKSYIDFRNQTVTLPLGAASFADRVVVHKQGTKAPKKSEADPRNALGEPDYKKAGDGKAFTLGCRGQATFEFTDNALVDVPGPDLHVFEVGRDVEPTRIELSKDGVNWTSIGEISGGRTSVDIAKYGLAGQDFRFVRVTDLGKYCGGGWPGADIDAIAAVGSATRLMISGNVLFDFDKSELRPGAGAALEELVAKLKDLKVTGVKVVGHTDAKGSDSYNLALSRKRAKSVSDYLKRALPGLAATITWEGRGEREPVADNASEQGRQKNRRVEIIVNR